MGLHGHVRSRRRREPASGKPRRLPHAQNLVLKKTSLAHGMNSVNQNIAAPLSAGGGEGAAPVDQRWFVGPFGRRHDGTEHHGMRMPVQNLLDGAVEGHEGVD